MAPLRCKECGFTALELLVATAIAALLLSLAVPGFDRLRSGASISSSANQILRALHQARSIAILKNIPTAVCLSADGASCLTRAGASATGWIVFQDNARSSPVQIGAGDEILYRATLPEHVTVTGTRAAVVYWPTPRAGTTSTFEICSSRDDTDGRSVIVSQTGRPRVVVGVASCGL
jgi:type IV fimbrial biogenesis protein FimT